MPLIHGRLDDRRALIDVGLQPTLQAIDGVLPVSQSSDFVIKPLRGLLDTGAQITCVTRSTARAVGLVPRGKKRLGNVSNIEIHTAYSFVLGVWYVVDNGGPNNQTKGYYGFDPILGCDFSDNANFDVLIGMDIISQGDFSTKRSGEFEWFLP
jgi:hypothetical protein